MGSRQANLSGRQDRDGENWFFLSLFLWLKFVEEVQELDGTA